MSARSDEIWLNVHDIALFYKEDARWARKWARKHDLKKRPPAKRRNGKGYEYLLPDEARLDYLSRKISGDPLMPTVRERGHVPEKFRAKVNKFLPSVLAIIEGSSSYKAEALKLGRSERTVRRKVERYLARGEAGLTPNIRSDAGKSKIIGPKLAAYIQKKVVLENLSITGAADAVQRDLPTLGEPGRVPKYGAIRRFVKNANLEDVRVLAHKGKREWIRSAGPYIVRDISGMKAYQWLVGDSRKHDVWVWNDGTFPVEICERGKAIRLWMTMMLDWATFRVMGVIWSPEPSSRTINAAIRKPLVEFGLPDNFYFDNGKDYQSVGRALSAILTGYSVEVTSAQPYNARAKVIEPYFQRVAQFDRKWGDAYCGSRPELRSPKCDEALKEHKLFLEGKARKTPLRTVEEFIMAGAQELDDNNARPDRRLNGRSPNEVFQEQLPPESRRMVDRRMLDRLLWQRDVRVVQQGGCIELNKIRYEGCDDQSSAALMGRLQQRVLIARDAYDLGTAVAFDEDSGAFIGELWIQQTVEQSSHGRLSVDGIRAMRRKRGEMLRVRNSYLAALEKMSEANKWKSEVDSLLDKAGVLATGTDDRAILSNAPGASALPEKREQRQLPASPFISDAAKEDAALFAHFFDEKAREAEDGDK